MSLVLLGVPARAQPKVELRLSPAGERADRIGARTRELLQATGIELSVSVQVVSDAAVDVPREPALAFVAIDATDSARVQIRIDSAAGASSVREVALEAGQLDEAACEEIATVVRSSVEALLAGQPLPGAQPEPPGAAASAPGMPPAQAATVVAQPASAETAPVQVDAAADTEPRGPRPELQIRAGYEAALWGEGHVLHGPQLVASRDWPLTWGRLGVRAEGFVAVPGRVESGGVDAELWAAAVRLLAVADFPLDSRVAAEAALGMSVQYTRLDGLSAPSDAEARAASTHWSWGARVYAGARLRLGQRSRGLAALGLALELDPVRVQYGVQYADGFQVTHEPLPVRPSLVASGGMVF